MSSASEFENSGVLLPPFLPEIIDLGFQSEAFSPSFSSAPSSSPSSSPPLQTCPYCEKEITGLLLHHRCSLPSSSSSSSSSSSASPSSPPSFPISLWTSKTIRIFQIDKWNTKLLSPPSVPEIDSIQFAMDSFPASTEGFKPLQVTKNRTFLLINPTEFHQSGRILLRSIFQGRWILKKKMFWSLNRSRWQESKLQDAKYEYRLYYGKDGLAMRILIGKFDNSIGALCQGYQKRDTVVDNKTGAKHHRDDKIQKIKEEIRRLESKETKIRTKKQRLIAQLIELESAMTSHHEDLRSFLQVE